MPNWTDCELKVCGKPNEVERFLEHAKSERTQLEADNFIPYPKEYADSDKARKKAIEEFNELPKEEQQKRYKEGNTPDEIKDGFNSGGFDWCVEHWGTKWGLCDVEITDESTYNEERTVDFEFKTAWRPPTPVIKKMGEMFPKLSFTLRYFEMGMEFNGILEMENGETEREEEASYFGHRGG